MGNESKALRPGSIPIAFFTRATAKRISLDSRVVVQRIRLSPNDLAAVQREGSYGPVPREEEVCELETGGQVLARGRIVKKRGKYFFQIREILNNEREEQ